MTTAIEADAAGALIAKHLPPSASTLHLLDLNGALAKTLVALRPDIDVTVGVPENPPHESCGFDAIVAYDAAIDADLLRRILALLRPGGRFIAVDSQGTPDRGRVSELASIGYVRILVEDTFPAGMLMRGEQAHETTDTLARIQSVASQDEALDSFKGRFVHLLIRQTPNKPVWALKPNEVVEWQAAALADAGDQPILLAFSSLPNAVAFMQPAVICGSVTDVNKVAKFSRATAKRWRLLVNPTLDALSGFEVIFVPINPHLAESPDE